MYFSRACHRVYETTFHNFSFVSTHHYFLLMDCAVRRMQRATTSSLHHPLQISNHFHAHSNCNIAARVQDLYISGLSKSITICNSANSVSQIGNRLNKLHIDSLLISTKHQSLLLGCADLTRKGYLLSYNTWWNIAVKDITICATGITRFCVQLCPQIWLVAAARLPSLQASYQQQHQAFMF